MDALDRVFPWELAYAGDGSGLLVGAMSSEVRRVMCAVDLTTVIVQAAIDSHCELLVTHHPHLFAGRGSSWDFGTPGGAIARLATLGGLNIVGCRGNADAGEYGAAALAARHLRLEEPHPLEPAESAHMARIVVFIPGEALEDVSASMAEAGAGKIGDYTHCGFRVDGKGTFVPGPGADPYSGERGTLNLVDETRLEMVVPSFAVDRVVSAMLEKHPYDEVAYDVYRTTGPALWGRGRIGTLPGERSLSEIMEDLSAWCDAGDAVLTGDPETGVSLVAVAPGNADLLVGAARSAGAELLVAGEVGWAGTVEACEVGMAVLCLGHLESERPLVPEMVGRLLEMSGGMGLELSVEGYKDQEGRWG
jgi:hypothetical protein